MKFEHIENIRWPECNNEDTPNGRFYVTPSGDRYPSVTTIIGKCSDKTWLEDWKKRIGEKEANRISRFASQRGSDFHNLVEQYLKNNPNYLKGVFPIEKKNFLSIKHHLDDNISKIAGLEVALWSDKLRVAGRVDCIAKWKNEWAIIDFKTSRRIKEKDQIHNYFIQESCYSAMLFERTGIKAKKLVTIMSIDENNDSKIFEENVSDWLSKFIEMRKSIDI